MTALSLSKLNSIIIILGSTVVLSVLVLLVVLGLVVVGKPI